MSILIACRHGHTEAQTALINYKEARKSVLFAIRNSTLVVTLAV